MWNVIVAYLILSKEGTHVIGPIILNDTDYLQSYGESNLLEILGIEFTKKVNPRRFSREIVQVISPIVPWNCWPQNKTKWWSLKRSLNRKKTSIFVCKFIIMSLCCRLIREIKQGPGSLPQWSCIGRRKNSDAYDNGASRLFQFYQLYLKTKQNKKKKEKKKKEREHMFYQTLIGDEHKVGIIKGKWIGMKNAYPAFTFNIRKAMRKTYLEVSFSNSGSIQIKKWFQPSTT